MKHPESTQVRESQVVAAGATDPTVVVDAMAARSFDTLRVDPLVDTTAIEGNLPTNLKSENYVPLATYIDPNGNTIAMLHSVKAGDTEYQVWGGQKPDGSIAPDALMLTKGDFDPKSQPDKPQGWSVILKQKGNANLPAGKNANSFVSFDFDTEGLHIGARQSQVAIDVLAKKPSVAEAKTQKIDYSQLAGFAGTQVLKPEIQLKAPQPSYENRHNSIDSDQTFQDLVAPHKERIATLRAPYDEQLAQLESKRKVLDRTDRYAAVDVSVAIHNLRTELERVLQPTRLAMKEAVRPYVQARAELVRGEAASAGYLNAKKFEVIKVSGSRYYTRSGKALDGDTIRYGQVSLPETGHWSSGDGNRSAENSRYSSMSTVIEYAAAEIAGLQPNIKRPTVIVVRDTRFQKIPGYGKLPLYSVASGTNVVAAGRLVHGLDGVVRPDKRI